MARTLPWKIESKPTTGPKRKKQKVQEYQVDDASNESPSGSPPSKPINQKARYQSSSPPPPPSPPQQNPMIPGYDADDRYVMVEDEFEAVAKTFARHLHHAEYTRLRREARKQTVQSAVGIMRPVDPRTKVREPTKKAMQRVKNSRAHTDIIEDMLQQQQQQKTGIGMTDQAVRAGEMNFDTDSEDGDDPAIGTSLHGLLAHARPSQQSLSGLAGIKSNTRAAAGCSPTSRKMPDDQSRRIRSSDSGIVENLDQAKPVDDPGSAASMTEDEEDDDDDDDLDGPVLRQTPTPKVRESRTSSLDHNKDIEDNIEPQSTVIHSKYDRPASFIPTRHPSTTSIVTTSTTPMTSSSQIHKKTAASSYMEETPLDDYPMPTVLSRGSNASRYGNYSSGVSQRKDGVKGLERRESANLNEVPTFLM